MKERIRELAHQADLVIKKSNGNDFRFGAMDPKLEKFAELIIKECARIIESQDVDPAFKQRMAWAMKENFGVK